MGWKARSLKERYYDIKWTIKNHFSWHKALKTIRPWEGFDGLLTAMITHLQQYIETEKKYGYAAKEYKDMKIATANETVQLLRRMKDPDKYSFRRVTAVEKKYPEYKSLVTKYIDGGGGYSGDFVAQGSGWAGMESGANPRSGYFEFVNNRFELVKSPDQVETDRLLAEIEQYHKDIRRAYRQAEKDSDRDFKRLSELLKDNLYSWWD